MSLTLQKSVVVTLSVVAFLLAASRVNHGLVDSPLPVGPGVTLDEPINVTHGIYLFNAAMRHGPLLFTPAGARAVFGADDYLADHPPLGRLCIGAAHEFTAWLIGGAELSAINLPAARLASCLAFALTVLLAAEFSRRRYGAGTAIAVAVALMLMPRVVAHARLASLETFTSVAWLAALLPVLAWWTRDEPPTNRQAAVSGVFFGLLLLTKIQGILLPPLIVAWAFWQYRVRAIRPLAVWGFVAAVVLFAGWPWLWLDPVDNTIAYFRRASDRLTLYAWYFNHRYTDKAVPWHFPFVMTALTVPASVLLAIGWRVLRRATSGKLLFADIDRVDLLLSLSIAWPLIVFSLPGTPVYDGTRLFLVIMPPLSLLAGRGLMQMFACVRQESGAPKAARVAAGACLALIAADLIFVTQLPGPYAVDYYNFAGQWVQSPSANSPPLEAGYWADALNGDFWKHVPENSTVLVAPVSHQFQLSDWEQCVPIVRQRNIRLVPFEYDPRQRGILLLVHRLADLRPSLRTVPEGAGVLAEISCRGTVLARLMDTTAATWTEVGDWPEEMR